MNTKWLDTIHVGDIVIVAGEGFGAARASICQVIKRTKIQLHIQRANGNIEKYSLRDGRPIGAAPFSAIRLEQATAEAVSGIHTRNKKTQLINKLHDVLWGALTIEQLQQIVDIIPPTAHKLS